MKLNPASLLSSLGGSSILKLFPLLIIMVSLELEGFASLYLLRLLLSKDLTVNVCPSVASVDWVAETLIIFGLDNSEGPTSNFPKSSVPSKVKEPFRSVIQSNKEYY